MPIAHADVIYPVRDIDPNSSKFNTILKKVIELREESKELRKYKVIKVLKPGSYIVVEDSRKNNPNAKITLFGAQQKETPIVDKEQYWLKCKKDLKLGSKINEAFVISTETYKFAGKNNIRKLEPDSHYDKETLLAELKKGTKYKYEVKIKTGKSEYKMKTYIIQW